MTLRLYTVSQNPAGHPPPPPLNLGPALDAEDCVSPVVCCCHGSVLLSAIAKVIFPVPVFWTQPLFLQICLTVLNDGPVLN